MNILFVSQVFYPDTVSVAQHLSDFIFYLSNKGFKVTIYTSRYSYEKNDIKYKKFEKIKNIKIIRLDHFKSKKNNLLFRIFEFLTFILNVTSNLIFIKKNKYNCIVGLSLPPMVPVICTLISKIKSIPFYYWVMDLQPELSINSGLIKKNSLTSKALSFFGDYSIKNAKKIISLDRFMSKYLILKGANSKNIKVVPPWPVINKFYKGDHFKNPFRVKHNFKNKIVIMFSGNHAYVHPLYTLLESCRMLKDDNRFLFVFIGGGIRVKDVNDYKIKYKLNNIIQLPFQPRENIHISLASSDIQVVIMGENQVGFTHPNKLYGALYLGKPILYVGPKISHVSDELNNLYGNISVQHGQSDLLYKKLLNFSNLTDKEKNKIIENNKKYALENFNPLHLIEKMDKALF